MNYASTTRLFVFPGDPNQIPPFVASNDKKLGELLAACGIERLTPGAGIGLLFTSIIIEALEKLNGAPMTVGPTSWVLATELMAIPFAG